MVLLQPRDELPFVQFSAQISQLASQHKCNNFINLERFPQAYPAKCTISNMPDGAGCLCLPAASLALPGAQGVLSE